LKCYVHPDVDAVGVCSACKRPICRSCVRLADDKVYCKRDYGRMGDGAKEADAYARRGAAITLAAVLAYLGGVIGMAGGFLLAILGVLGPEIPQASSAVPSLQPVFGYFAVITALPATAVIEVGVFVLVIGTADVGAGYYLWQCSRAAAVVTVAASILGATLTLVYLGAGTVGGSIALGYVLLVFVKTLAIAAGRRHLGGMRPQRS
jgi:hypothetical protein